ncbi:MAG: sugar transferase [Robiginitomaculum sp.]|nr:MAG: sugar transferase [Robiginitomaculum sp.]
MKHSANIPAYRFQDTLNRAFDIFFSLIGLLLALPVFIFIAGLIWLEDRGAILFMQNRIGQKQKPFKMKKFRTMTEAKNRSSGDIQNDSGQSLSEQRAEFETTSKNDPRITRVGRFLRPMHLDELPQLLNVLIGDMSLVGVRPDVAVQEVEYQPQEWIDRHVLRPGITGLAQIDPSVDSMKARTEQDLRWVSRRNTGLYFKLLFLTVTKVSKRNSL